MKLSDKKALRDKDVAALNVQIVALKKEYAISKMQFAVGKLKNVRSLSTLRKTQAVISTIIREKEKLQA